MNRLRQQIDSLAQQPNKILISTEDRQISALELKLFAEEFYQKLPKAKNNRAILLVGKSLTQLLSLLALGYNDFSVALINPRLSSSEQRSLVEFISPAITFGLATELATASLSFSDEFALEVLQAIKTKKTSGEVDCSQTVKASLNSQSHTCSAEIIIFSSGTTGRPKAICHSWQNFFSSAAAVNRFLEINSTSSLGLTLPFCHAAGLAIISRSLLASCTLHVSATENLSIASFVRKFSLSHCSLVPAQLDELLAADEHTTKKAPPIILVGGSSISRNQLEKYRSANLAIYASYGMSETASTIAIANLRTQNNAALITGRVLDHLNLECFSSDQEPAEIKVSGQSLLLGYLTADGTIVAASKPFATGDLGFFTAEELSVVGRKDRLFISGGENIYPEELEKALLDHGDIKSTLIIPIKSKRWGVRPVALIEFKSTTEPIPTSQELRSFLRDKLANFKIPQHFLKCQFTTHSNPLQKTALKLGTKKGNFNK